MRRAPCHGHLSVSQKYIKTKYIRISENVLRRTSANIPTNRKTRKENFSV